MNTCSYLLIMFDSVCLTRDIKIFMSAKLKPFRVKSLNFMLSLLPLKQFLSVFCVDKSDDYIPDSLYNKL